MEVRGFSPTFTSTWKNHAESRAPVTRTAFISHLKVLWARSPPWGHAQSASPTPSPEKKNKKQTFNKAMTNPEKFS